MMNETTIKNQLAILGITQFKNHLTNLTQRSDQVDNYATAL
jgi:hypothetical protein